MQTTVFRDFDAFASSVRGADCTMMMQNPARHSWSIRHSNLPDVQLQLGRLGSGNIVEGQASAVDYVLYLSLTAACDLSVAGTALTHGSFMLLEPGCEFSLSSKSQHDWLSINVPAHKFGRGDTTRCHVTPPDRLLADRARGLVDDVMVAAANCSQFESSLAATCASADLLRLASVIVGKRQTGEPCQAGRPRLPRQEVIRRCKAVLEARDDRPVRVEELAAAVNVSERTLRTVFQQYFGVGPSRYLQLRRLHQVHHALKAADPEAVSVGDVLVQHGEWEFSRFAARYRKLFGERPSETLRTIR